MLFRPDIMYDGAECFKWVELAHRGDFGGLDYF